MEHPVRHSGSREPCRIPYGHTGSRIVTQDPVSSFRVSYRRTGSRIVTQDPAWSSRIPYGHAGSRTVIQDPGRSCRIRYGHKGIRHGHKGSGKILPDPLCHTGFLDMGKEEIPPPTWAPLPSSARNGLSERRRSGSIDRVLVESM